MKIRLLIIALAICVISTPAIADLYGTVDVTYEDMVWGVGQVDVTWNGDDGIAYNVGLSQLYLTNLSLSSPPDLPSASYLTGNGFYNAFCIDLYDAFPSSTFPENYNVSSLDDLPNPSSGNTGEPMGDENAKYIAQLLNTSSYSSDAEAAAVQVAIWEIIYETEAWDLDSGDFIVNDASIASDADDLLLGLTKASSFSRYTGLGNENTIKPTQDFVLVPVPAAVILGILGLGVVGIKLRKYA